MKILKYFVLLVFFALIASCRTTATYETFKYVNDSFASRKVSMQHEWLQDIYKKQDYSDSEYIYIYTGPSVDKRCVHGYIVDKKSPYQLTKSWKILSGKKFCKIMDEYFLLSLSLETINLI
jgi:hypothetical protein